MKIVADENIRLLKHFFLKQATIITKPGREIVRADLVDADVLLVRTVTRVDKHLLHDTSVRFVGSTTVGEDHLDTEWLKSQGIAWSIAKGCNTTAVVEYVICVIAALQKQGLLNSSGLRAGVIGVGEIGSRVVKILRALGFTVIMHDPLRAAEQNFISTPLEQFADLDLISLHVPLTEKTVFPTYHLMDEKFLRRQKKKTVMINTSRGAVLDTNAWLNAGKHLIGCFDVWENEPNISADMLASAHLATPHIAGYSVQSKLRGMELIYQALLRANILSLKPFVEIDYPRQNLLLDKTATDWRDLVLAVFDPRELSAQMKADPLFDGRRGQFDSRYEFRFIDWENKELAYTQMLNWYLQLGLE
ncbi:hypothetical protein AYO45_04025 [Gammaproteobacteria bacterium SCGC AG-212-F23]|nr:hypothetical protein AYO45_04025 [Gammaproteobacteria bacterium SCGC AG-212-F23]